MIMEPLCVVLHRNPKWRDSGERLLREMDSFDFIEAWDAAVKERQTVPSVTTQMLIADAVTAHLTTAMSKRMPLDKCSLAARRDRIEKHSKRLYWFLIRLRPRCSF
jgi:hypothetical protein